MVDDLKYNSDKKDYLPVQGLLELREAICSYFNDNVLVSNNIDSSQLLITPGTKQAFFLLKLALTSECEILLPNPSWVTYSPQSLILGRKLTWIETTYDTNWKILPSNLEKYLEKQYKIKGKQQSLLILNSPSNPTGIKYNISELIEIANICRKYNVIILSDEIYGDLYHDNDNDEYYSMYDLYPENIIITNGISKSFGAGGWRLGYMIFGKDLIKKSSIFNSIFISSSETHTSVSCPIQYAAINAFNHYQSKHIQNYMILTRKILNNLAFKFYNLLSRIDGCNVKLPMGGFYIFPDFTNITGIGNMQKRWSKQTGKDINEWNGNEFTMFLLQETGVAGLSGDCFGRCPNELTVRLSFVDFDGNKLFNDINIDNIDNLDNIDIDKLVNKHCNKTIQGMHILYDYLSTL